MFAYVLSVAVFLVVGVDSQTFYNNRIVGGESARIENYPYQVSLQIGGYHICGGSIISEQYVVTAGHCVQPDQPVSSLSLRVGSSYHGRGGSLHRIERIIRHENYHVDGFGVPINDIAIIKVKTPFTFRQTIKPIGLFEMNEESSPGSKAIITGWGTTGGWDSPRHLQSVAVPIIEKNLCSNAYKSMGGLPGGQICAGFFDIGGKDACQGDSGGPLAINGRLAGIVSWGRGCGEPHFPGVFTEVARYRGWINKHAQLM